MIQFDLKNKNYILIEVPSDAYDFSFRRNNQIIYLRKNVINPLTGIEKSVIIDIPNTKYGFVVKDWSIVGKLSEVLQNKELCKQLMEKYNWSRPYSHLWTKFVKDKKKEAWWTSKATDSFKSFLQSINVDMSKEYLLISKN